MPVISADLFRLGLVKMTGNPPVVPATPTFSVARITGESLNFQPSVTTSNELDPSGQVRDSILTGAQTTGSIEGELSKNPTFEMMMASVFRNGWGVGTVGDGSGTPATPAGANELIPGSLLDLYAIEKRFNAITVGDYLYHQVNLSAMDTLSIAISTNAPITTSFGVSGGPLLTREAALAGATYPDPGTNPVFTAPDVVEVIIDGVTSTLCFSSLNLSFNSNIRGIECIGTLGFREQALGRFEATIEGSAYFVSNDLLEQLVTQDEFPFEVTLADSENRTYTFFYPRTKMTSGSANASGTNQDVVQNISLQALYSPNHGYSVMVTRSA